MESVADGRDHQCESDDIKTPRDALPDLRSPVLVSNHLTVRLATGVLSSPVIGAALFDLINEAHQNVDPQRKEVERISTESNRPVRALPFLKSWFMTVPQYPPRTKPWSDERCEARPAAMWIFEDVTAMIGVILLFVGNLIGGDFPVIFCSAVGTG